jgi:hypothetical protein
VQRAVASLREARCLNPRPQDVSDEAFVSPLHRLSD